MAFDPDDWSDKPKRGGFDPNEWTETIATGADAVPGDFPMPSSDPDQPPLPPPPPKTPFGVLIPGTPEWEAAHPIEPGIKAIQRNVRNALSFGLDSRIHGAFAALKARISGNDPKAAYELEKAQKEEELDRALSEFPVQSLGGQLIGNLIGGKATGAVTSRAAANSGPLMGTAIKAGAPIIEGAVTGAGNTKSDKPGDLARGALTGAAVTAGMMGTARGLGEVISTAPTRKITERISDVARSASGKAMPSAIRELTGREGRNRNSVYKLISGEIPEIKDIGNKPAAESLQDLDAGLSRVSRESARPSYKTLVDAEGKQKLTKQQVNNRLDRMHADENALIASESGGGNVVRRDAIEEAKKQFNERFSGLKKHDKVSIRQIADFSSDLIENEKGRFGGMNITTAHTRLATLSNVGREIKRKRLQEIPNLLPHGSPERMAAETAVKRVSATDRQIAGMLDIRKVVAQRAESEASQAGKSRFASGVAGAAEAASVVGASTMMQSPLPAIAWGAARGAAKIARPAGRWASDNVLAPAAESYARGPSADDVSRAFWDEIKKGQATGVNSESRASAKRALAELSKNKIAALEAARRGVATSATRTAAGYGSRAVDSRLNKKVEQ